MSKKLVESEPEEPLAGRGGSDQAARAGSQEALRAGLLPTLRRQPVDPLVGLGAGEVGERLADAVLEALDTVLATPLGRQGLEEVDLALAGPLGASPPLRRSLGSLGLSVVLDGPRFLGGALLRARPGVADGGGPAARRSETVGGRGVVAVGELLEGRGADVHRVAQSAGLRPRLRHPDHVRHDVAPDVLGARRSEEHTSELQSRQYLVCRLLLEKKKQ